MRTPGGYAVWTEADGQVKETDTFTCKHCQFVVFVPARTDPANLGGLCKQCMGLICPKCAAQGICTPFEKALEKMEARGRFLRSAGLGVLLLSLWTATAGAQPITVAGRACTREITTDRVLVECGQGGYGLQFRPEGVYELTKGATPRSWRAQKLRPLPPELDPLIPPADGVALDSVSTPVATAADATTVQRVLYLYTPRTKQAAGGTDNMLAAVVALITASNIAYANSNVNLRLVLTDVVEVAYTETTIQQDLARLRHPSDGFIDWIHAKRDADKADLVQMAGEGYASAGACGIGYLMTNVGTWFASSAFSVVDRKCNGQLTPTHEFGHNQGLNHDPANASPTCPPNFNCGHRVAGLFRTVLSYGSETRIPYLSSPSIFYAGVATGTATRDNRRRLLDTMATVANFRVGEPTTPPPAPPPPQTQEQVSITSTATSVAPGATYTITCSVVTSGLHEYRCDVGVSGGTGPAPTTVNGVWTKTLTYTMGTVSKTHTASAKRLSDNSLITASIVVSPSTQTCNPPTISPASATVAANGGTVPVTVTADAGCSWAASSSASWITVSPTSGSGNGTATLTIAANPNTSQRLGTATVAGQTVTITQEAAVISNPCVDDPFVAAVTTWPVDTAVTSVTHTDTRGCTTTSPRPVAGGEAADDFNRPDGPAGANWAWQVSAGTIRSGSLGSSSDALAIGWWVPGAFPDNQFSEAVVSPGFAVGTPPSVTLLQVFVRRQDSGFARYGFHFNQASSTTWIYELKYDGISPGVVIATVPAPGPWQPGDVVRIEAQGNQIRGLVNGTVVISGTHDTLVSGRPGLVINPLGPTSLQSYDSWRGGAQ